MKLLDSVLGEVTGLLKLHFGLQTGALVLFVKVLTDLHSAVAVRVALAISIFLFGAPELTCLSLLVGLAEAKVKMLNAWADVGRNWSEMFGGQMKKWQRKMGKTGTAMEWLS